MLLVATKGHRFTRAALVVALLPPLLSTLLWHKSFFIETAVYPPMTTSFGAVYDIDCALVTGPIERGSPRLRYVESSAFYQFNSCQPSLFGGGRGDGWLMAIHPAFGREALDAIRRSSARATMTSAICRADATLNDSVCSTLRTQTRCTPMVLGGPLLECPVSGRVRAELLGGVR
jgi:hypothetical protein